MDVVATGPHLVVAAGIDVEKLRRFAGPRIEAQVSTLDLAVPPLLDTAIVGDNPRGQAVPPFRNVPIEHVSRFGDVVIDADQDQVIRSHRSLLPPCYRATRSCRTSNTLGVLRDGRQAGAKCGSSAGHV